MRIESEFIVFKAKNHSLMSRSWSLCTSRGTSWKTWKRYLVNGRSASTGIWLLHVSHLCFFQFEASAGCLHHFCSKYRHRYALEGYDIAIIWNLKSYLKTKLWKSNWAKLHFLQYYRRCSGRKLWCSTSICKNHAKLYSRLYVCILESEFQDHSTTNLS